MSCNCYHLVNTDNPVNEKNVLSSALSGLGYTVVAEQLDTSWLLKAEKNGENILQVLFKYTENLFFKDTFTDSNKMLTDHTADIGGGWTRKNNFWGNLQIHNGRICGDFNEANSRTNVIPSSANYFVKCKIHIVTEEGPDFAGPCGRLHVTDSNFYLASAEPAMNRWRLLKMNLGVWTTLGVWSVKPVTGDEVELRVTNTSKKLLVNGVERITSTDNSITDVGYAGAYCNFSTPTQGVHLDDLKAGIIV